MVDVEGLLYVFVIEAFFYFCVVFFYQIRDKRSLIIGEGEDDFLENFFLGKRSVLYGFLGSLGVGLDKSTDAEECSSKVSGNYQKDVMKLIPFKDGEYGFPCGVCGFAVVIRFTVFRVYEYCSEKVLVDVESGSVG
jgi:hypothetical protein